MATYHIYDPETYRYVTSVELPDEAAQPENATIDPPLAVPCRREGRDWQPLETTNGG